MPVFSLIIISKTRKDFRACTKTQFANIFAMISPSWAPSSALAFISVGKLQTLCLALGLVSKNGPAASVCDVMVKWEGHLAFDCYLNGQP